MTEYVIGYITYFLNYPKMNYWAILLVAITHAIIGMLWYSPMAFGKIWMNGVGIKAKDAAKENMFKPVAINIVASLVMAFSLNYLAILTGSVTTTEYIEVAFWIWLGFIATSLFNSVIWEKQNPNVYIINSGFWLVALIIDAGILALV